MTSINLAVLDGDAAYSPPLTFHEAWASIMSCPVKRKWAFNHHFPSSSELLRARDNQPFSKSIFLDAPSDGPTFEADVYRFRMEDLFCTTRRLPDGTNLGFVLNSACADFAVPCFSAFDPCFGDLQLNVVRLICGAVAGRLYVMEFCWLKSGALTVRFGPYQSLSTSKRNDLRMNHMVYAFLPNDVPLLSATALCPGQPSDDFINARFENIFLSDDWYLLKVTDTCFQIACVFCASRGAAVCGCPLPMKRRAGNAPEVIGYKARTGKTFWEEFGTVKSICANRGTVVFNVTKAPHSRHARVMDSGVFPFDYTVQLNVMTSESLQKHLRLTGKFVRAMRTVLMPFSTRDNGKRLLLSPPSSVEEFAPPPITISSVNSGKEVSSLSNTSSTNELISLIRGTRKRARVQNAAAVVVANSGPASSGDVETVVDATSMVVNRVPVVTEVLSSNEKSRGGTAESRAEGENRGQTRSQTQTQTQPPSQPKVYICPECGMLIKNKRYNLKRHIQVVHQKERNFECTLPNCGQRFTTKTNLKRHVSKVHKNLQIVQEQEQRVGQEAQDVRQTVQQAPVQLVMMQQAQVQQAPMQQVMMQEAPMQQVPMTDSLFNIHNDVIIGQPLVAANPLFDVVDEGTGEQQEQQALQQALQQAIPNSMFDLRNGQNVEHALVVGEQEPFE